MRIAIHQANFIPWFPYFQKMAQCNKFVILCHCQFEKGGYQNRANINGKWWTIPVKKGLVPINRKLTIEGRELLSVNMLWIMTIATTLNIDVNKIVFDFETENTGTNRLIEICEHYDADEYLANPDAFNKYLDKDKFDKAGIKFVPFTSQYKKHVFEMFDTHGIEGTRKLLYK